MKTEILKMLRNAETSVSGQQICTDLGVSRTAVWKVINQLKEEGYQIEAVQNKGYRITGFPDLVTESEIKSRLNTEYLGCSIEYLESIDSTNNHGRRLAEDGALDGTLITADMQVAGKGRRGRSWSMAPKTAVAMSLILRPSIMPMHASRITLIMGLSVAQALNDLYHCDARIKWPNDVVLNGKKICGILTELSSQLDYINYVVIGVGINANLPQLPEEISDKATSLQIELGRKVNRSELIVKVLSCFEKNLTGFLENEDLTDLREEYNSLLIHMNTEVKIVEGKNEYAGTSLGINEKGELLVRKPDGAMTAVYAGEISVRGVHGYV